jgi:hypothetical protein
MFPSLISIIRDIFQSLFFITVGTVTILTYLKAKKTLLQPIRTEVFKEQIKIFSDILNFFIGKKEIELRKEFSFDKLFAVNCISLMDDYASFYFKLEFDIDKRPYNPSACPSSIVFFEYAKRFFILADNYLDNELDEKKSLIENNQNEWKNYIYGEIKLPKETSDKLKELDKIMDSPLIPKTLFTLLEKYKGAIEENIHLIETILTQCSQELPNKYPDLETLEKAAFGWIHKKYNDKFVCLEEKSQEITDYVRNYFATDDLFN